VPHRLLLLNTDLELGGTPTVVRELALRLRSPAVDVEVACLSGWGPVADALQQLGVKVTALGAKRVADVWIIRRLIDLIRERPIDTVLSFLLHANAIAAAAKPACGQTRFFQSIQTTQAHPKWHWQVQRFVHHAAEHVIVPSASVAEVARIRAKVPAEKITVIPNAVDVDEFPISLIPAANPRPFPIGFLGRLDPVKMVPDLVRAVESLGDVHLHIFGDGPDREAVERTVRLLKLTERVTLHGKVARPQEALGQIGLLVLPSISEGMPMVLIEAMAAGVAVLGRDVPGVRDVIEDGRTGVLVKSLDVAALGEGIRSLVGRAEMRAAMIEAGRAMVREKYSWEAVLPRYREVLGIG
jgi:glycosyltransferase involved in cell wall biosynthesis